METSFVPDIQPDRLTEQQELLSWELHEAYVTLGMPQLSLGGISENWLLKECGHLHWLALARVHGMTQPDFWDDNGNRLYAAFTTVRIIDAQFSMAKENDILTISTSISRMSRTQNRSVHSASVGHIIVATIEMHSVFLRRREVGSNRSIERAYSDKLNTLMLPKLEIEGAEHCRRIRSGQWKEHLGFERDRCPILLTEDVVPCPRNDFNGAEFLYFANFQAIVDRIEWRWRPEPAYIAHTKHREIFYHANIDVGDIIAVVLRGGDDQSNAARHWCQLFRRSDGKQIADIFTVRETCQ